MRTNVAELLLDIEGELRRLGLWDKIPPSAAALTSDQPFCVDTLTLSQWLQYVLIPNLRALLDDDRGLPERCGVAPMAQEYFKDSGLAIQRLVGALDELDIVLSGESSKG